VKPGVTRIGEFSLGLRLSPHDPPVWSWEVRRLSFRVTPEHHGPLASFVVPAEDDVMKHWDRAQRMLQAAVTHK
jgi:hypothetical protein